MSGFDNEVLHAINVDFRGVQPVVPQITQNGQLLIGSGVAPNIRAGFIKSNDGSVTITSGMGTIDLSVSSAGGNITLTGDSGGALGPAAAFNILGQQAGTVPVIDTIGSGTTLNIENRTWLSQYVVDPSATVGLRGTYQTISSAMAQAVLDGNAVQPGANIYIRTNTSGYFEDIIVGDDEAFNLIAITPNNANQLTIAGNLSIGNSAYLSLSNIVMSPPGLETATNSGTLYLYNAIIALPYTGTNGYIYSYNSNLSSSSIETAAGKIYLYDNSQIASLALTSTSQLWAYFSLNITFTMADTSLCNIYNCTSINMATAAAGTTANFYGNCSFVFPANSTGVVTYSNLSADGLVSSFFSGPPATLTKNPSIQGNVLQTIRTAVSYVVLVGDCYIGVTDTSAPRTITLPDPATICSNQTFIIKDESGGAGTNNIIVNTAAGLIDGAATQTITQNYSSFSVTNNGTNYFIL